MKGCVGVNGMEIMEMYHYCRGGGAMAGALAETLLMHLPTALSGSSNCISKVSSRS